MDDDGPKITIEELIADVERSKSINVKAFRFVDYSDILPPSTQFNEALWKHLQELISTYKCKVHNAAVCPLCTLLTPGKKEESQWRCLKLK